MGRHVIQRNTKGRQPPKRKTDRRELTPFQRGIVVNLAEEAGISHIELARRFHCSQAAVSGLIKRTKERAEAEKLPLTAEELYQNPSRARKPVLNEEHKDILEQLINQSPAHLKLDAKQIKARGEAVGLPADFPDVSVSTIECALYERGYHRVKHQIKPTDKPEFLVDPPQQNGGFGWDNDNVVTGGPPLKGNGHKSYYYCWGKVNDKENKPKKKSAKRNLGSEFLEPVQHVEQVSIEDQIIEQPHHSDALERTLESGLAGYNEVYLPYSEGIHTSMDPPMDPPMDPALTEPINAP